MWQSLDCFLTGADRLTVRTAISEVQGWKTLRAALSYQEHLEYQCGTAAWIVGRYHHGLVHARGGAALRVFYHADVHGRLVRCTDLRTACSGAIETANAARQPILIYAGSGPETARPYTSACPGDTLAAWPQFRTELPR